MTTPPGEGIEEEAFNEQRYKRLLERLEVSIQKLSECKNIIDFRIDANTYRKDYLRTELFLNNRSCKTIDELSISVQNFGAYSLCNFINFSDKGIPFLMTENIRHNYIDWNIQKYVDDISHKMLYKSHCHKGQVLVTMAGEYLGRVAVYDKDFVCSSNQAIAKITLKEEINPYTIATFLNTIYGQNQINRLKTLTGQPNINMSLIKNLKIPDFSKEFSDTIEKIVNKSEETKEQSQILYRQAEELLLETIGLKDFKPSEKGTNIKSFKESFLATGRLDAEYYQPKYEEIINKIKSQPHDVLGNLVIIKKSIESGSDVYVDEGLPFIRVSDYNKFGISTPEKCLSEKFCKENTALLQSLYPTKDTILFSKDGSVGSAFMVRENMQAVTSGAILHLTVKDKSKILPDYLTLALNSEVVKQQAERDAGGSIILHWRVGEIEKVVVPVVDSKIQQQIAELIEKSFYLRRESGKLLEEAKEMVEREIEK